MTGFALADGILLGMLAVTGIALACIRHLFAVAMLSGLFSLTAASIFVLLDAADVAFTEAAVGAGMTTVLYLSALALTNSHARNTVPSRSIPAALVGLFTGSALIYATLDLPPFASPDTPVHLHPLTEHYLADSATEVGVPNVVTAVLASYRGFDTLGELVVIFTAGIGVLVLLGRRGGPGPRGKG